MDVKVPAVGESITSGLVSTWHAKDGAQVKSGDMLFTLETDKVSTEINAEASGVLHIKVAEGEEVKIGEVVATIEEGAAAPEPAEKKPEPPAEKRSEPAPAQAEEKIAVVQPPPQPAREDSPKKTEPAKSERREGRTVRKKMSPLRRKIAAQLVMAQQTAAILTTFNEADMTAVMTLRKEMQEAFTKEHGIKLGFMSFFIKAVVRALQAVPSINSRLEGEELVQNEYHDIGVAVGTERGLIVPVIREAGSKSFAEIERDLAAYAVKAREGKVTIDDLQGGVFTISNGGIYGSLLSTPILNPPQSGILGMHTIQERPVARDGQVVIRPMMYLALSYDHRVVDGKEAVTFLIRVKEAIEEPMRLLLDL